MTQPSITFAPVSELLIQEEVASRLAADPILDPVAVEAAIRSQVSEVDTLVNVQNAGVTLGLGLYSLGSGTKFTVVDIAQLTQAIVDDPSSFGFEAVKAGRILNSGSAPFPFVDSNSDGLPDEVPFGPLPFFTIGRDNGTPEAFVQLDPNVIAVDDDSLIFYDGFHASAAAQNIISEFFVKSLEGNVIFLSDDDNTYRTVRDFEPSDADVAFGLGGNDRMLGSVGNEVLFGNLGDDKLSGRRGNDVLVGGAGNDTIVGGFGDDVLLGSDGSDTLKGHSGDDVIRLGAGDDLAEGGFGNDVFIIDIMPGLTQTETIKGGKGLDTLFLEVGAEETASIEALIADFTTNESFSFAFNGTSVEIDDLDRIVVGERSLLPSLAFQEVAPADFRSPLGLQETYESALSELGAEARVNVNVAAQWNVVDPAVGAIA